MTWDTQKEKIKLLFIDRITILSLFRICLFGRELKTVWYFEPISVYVQRMIALLSYLHIIRAEIRLNHFNITQVRDESGVNQYDKIYLDIRDICSKIKRDHIVNNPLLERMEVLWERRKLNFYFVKAVERYATGGLVAECLRVGLVDWIGRCQYQFEPMT